MPQLVLIRVLGLPSWASETEKRQKKPPLYIYIYM